MLIVKYFVFSALLISSLLEQDQANHYLPKIRVIEYGLQPCLLYIQAMSINLHPNRLISSLFLEESLRSLFRLSHMIFNSYIRGTIVLYADTNLFILLC